MSTWKFRPGIKGTTFLTGSGSGDEKGTMRFYVDDEPYQVPRADALKFALEIISHLSRSGGVENLLVTTDSEVSR